MLDDARQGPSIIVYLSAITRHGKVLRRSLLPDSGCFLLVVLVSVVYYEL